MIAKKYEVWIADTCAEKLERLANTFQINPARFIGFFFQTLFRDMEIFNLVCDLKNADSSQPANPKEKENDPWKNISP